MAEAGGAPALVCEWGDCQDRFRSLVELEWHVRRHIDDLQLEEGAAGATAGTQRGDSDIINGPSGGDHGGPFEGSAGNDGPLPRGHARGNDKFSDKANQGDDSRCAVCQGGEEDHGNYMVLCDGCDRPYHQRCHRPAIHDATVRDRRAKWYCKRCALSSAAPTSASLHTLTPSIKKKK